VLFNWTVDGTDSNVLLFRDTGYCITVGNTVTVVDGSNVVDCTVYGRTVHGSQIDGISRVTSGTVYSRTVHSGQIASDGRCASRKLAGGIIMVIRHGDEGKWLLYR
jgi:hypothetical protein